MHSEWSRYFCAHTRHDITSCPHNTLKSLWRVCVFAPPLAFCPLYLISPPCQPVFQFYPDRFCVLTGALAVIQKLKCTSLQNKKKFRPTVQRLIPPRPLLPLLSASNLNLMLHFSKFDTFWGGAFLQPQGLARCYSS